MNRRGAGTAVRIAGLVLAAGWLVHELLCLPAWPMLGWGLAAAATYLLAHLVRGMRLFLLLYDGRVQVRGVVGTHLLAAAVSHAIPYKLGEIYRVVAVGGLLRRPSRAVMAVWSERLFDVLVLMVLVASITAIDRTSGFDPTAFFVLGAAFLFLSGFVFLVLPESLHLLIRYVVTRHNSRASLRLLELSERLLAVVARASRVLRTRWATVSWLSLLIWGLELCALALATRAVAPVTDGFLGTFAPFHVLALQQHTWDPAANGSAAQLVRLVTVDAFVSVVIIGALGLAGRWLARRGVVRKEAP
ncbi:MAG: lysylphosphatidylglycerol synthase domain-containing protein [Planctomycetota bacterium]